VHIKPEDDEKEIMDNLFKLLPFDLEKEKIRLKNNRRFCQERKNRLSSLLQKEDISENSSKSKRTSTKAKKPIIMQVNQLDPKTFFYQLTKRYS
jgi:hypothetical protein